MNEILSDLGDQQAELAGLIEGLDEDGWQRPSGCEGWTISDVLLHMAQTDEMALASARGTFEGLVASLSEGMPAGITDIDQGAGYWVDRERGAPGGAVGK